MVFRLNRAKVALLVGILAVSPVVGAGVAGARSGGAFCTNAAKQCLAAKARALGGGLYEYDFGSYTLTYRVPPAGFSALHATPAQLARYGLPQRPASGIRAWSHDMARLHMVGAPLSLGVVEAHAASSVPDYSDHWAGYVAYGGRYIRTASTWLEPAVRRSKCRSSSLTIWAGIGGYASPALAQDGTAVGTPGIGQHQAWWEMTPAGMVPVPLYATVGKRFTAEVHYLGGGRFSFFMENDFTGAAWSGVEKSTNGATLATAEAIVERPCLARCTLPDAAYANLANFGRVSFVSARANGRPLQSFSNYAEAMSSSGIPYGKELAFPGPYGLGGGGGPGDAGGSGGSGRTGGSGGTGGTGGFSVTHNSCS